MDKKEKLLTLEKELEIANKRYLHMLKEYSETKSGSAYGVEYYDIQLKVLESMVYDIKREIAILKSND